MTQDRIVDEVRAFRDEIAKKYEYDIDAIFVAFRQMEVASGRDHVSFQPRRAAGPTDSNADGVASQLGVANGAPKGARA